MTLPSFSFEACWMIFEVFDQDKSTLINLDEFATMVQTINMWWDKFDMFDDDKSGFLDAQELSQVLYEMGIKLNKAFAQKIITAYSKKNIKMTLDNTIVIIGQILRFTESFQMRDKDMLGSINLTYEDFMGVAMRAHDQKGDRRLGKKLFFVSELLDFWITDLAEQNA